MKPTIFVVLMAGLLLGACAPNLVSIEVLRARPFEEDCTVVPGDLARSRGFFDLRFADSTQLDPEIGEFPTSYFQGFEIQNNLLNNGSAIDFRLNTNNFVSESTTVTYDLSNTILSGESLTEEPPTPIAVTVEAGGNHGVIVNLIPISVGADLASKIAPGDFFTLVTTIQIKGHTGDGKTLTSGEFSFPVELCNGCTQTICSGSPAVFLCNQGHRPFGCPGTE